MQFSLNCYAKWEISIRYYKSSIDYANIHCTVFVTVNMKILFYLNFFVINKTYMWLHDLIMDHYSTDTAFDNKDLLEVKQK